MTEDTHEEPSVVHEPSREFVESTNVYEFMQAYGIDDYDELIRRTTESVDGVEASGVEWFWDTVPEYLDIDFYEPYDAVRDDSDGPQFSEWYPGGEINLAHNVTDRHAAADAETRNSVACIFEGEPGDVREVTYHELARQSNKVANYLESVGVETGDTVGLYMPMVPEVISILYGCFKVGAVAVPIFSGFGVEATATRIADSYTDQLARETECRAVFVVEENGRGVYMYTYSGKHAVWKYSTVGKRFHLHQTAAGKAILSQLPRERVIDIVEEWGLPASTENTTTDRSVLLEELDAIEDRGVAFNNEEQLNGVKAVGVPVDDSDGRVVGAFSVASPANRMTKDRFNEEIPKTLLGVANEFELENSMS